MLFLDEGFSAESIAKRLREAGFTVEKFHDQSCFQTSTGERLKNVKDPTVIRFCNEKRWLLVTTDHEMKNAHAAEIYRSKSVAILATAHNALDDPSEWVNAIITLKARILANLRSGSGLGLPRLVGGATLPA